MSAVVGGLSSSAAYAKGLWVRLNGGGRRHSSGGSTGDGGGNTSALLPSQLPAPVPTRAQRSAAIATLSREIDALEQKLQEASKVQSLLSHCLHSRTHPHQRSRLDTQHWG